MKITTETSLRNFNFCSGAKDNAKELSCNQLDSLETLLGDLYPDGMTSAELNDIMWFEFDTVKEWLGIDDFNSHVF